MKKTLKILALTLVLWMVSQPAMAVIERSSGDTPASDDAPQADASQADTQADSQADTQQSPAAKKPKSADGQYIIIPGDVLQITVWKEEELNQEVLVLNDGTINFPLIGSIPAQGQTTAELQDMIKGKLSKLVPDASVTVAVKAALGHTVNVIGQVTKPGELVMGHDLTVMQALSQAGGLTPYADEDRIIILHRTNGKETSIPFPYSDVVRGDELDKDIVLMPGDVVVVPTAGLL